MLPLIVIGIVGVLPVLTILALRSNAVLAFMALGLGSLLANFIYDDLNVMFGGFVSGPSNLELPIIKAVLLLLPYWLGILFTMKTAKKGMRSVLHIFPAIASGLACLVLVRPLLPANLQAGITDGPVWHYVTVYLSPALIAGTAVSFLLLLSAHRSRKAETPQKARA